MFLPFVLLFFTIQPPTGDISTSDIDTFHSNHKLQIREVCGHTRNRTAEMIERTKQVRERFKLRDQTRHHVRNRAWEGDGKQGRKSKYRLKKHKKKEAREEA